MTTQDLLASWTVTQRHLSAARAQLRPEVAQAHRSDLDQFLEFLDHNELGLAFSYLYSIAQESQWDSEPLLHSLTLAAENMGKASELNELQLRIRGLK